LSVGSNMSITNAGVKHLTKLKDLKFLDLCGTSIDIKCLDSLRQLPNLKELGIPMNMTDKSSVMTIRKAFPKIKLFAGSPESNTPAYCLDFDWKGEGL